MVGRISEIFLESGWPLSVERVLRVVKIKHVAQVLDARLTAVRDFGPKGSNFPETFSYTRTHDGGHPS
jgi:hypothetical protein